MSTEKFSNFFLCASIILCSTNLVASEIPPNALGCSISGPTSACAGSTLTFSRSCSNGNTFQWYIAGQDKGTGVTASHTFTQAGVYTVRVSYMEPGSGEGVNMQQGDQPQVEPPPGEDPMVPGYDMIQVTIYPKPGAPLMNFVNPDYCDNVPSITLSIAEPESFPVVYSWSSVPGGSSATGTSITLNNLTTTTIVTALATLNECTSNVSKTITVNKTDFTPYLDPSMPYHKRLLRGIGGTTGKTRHYWQTTSSGTNMEHNLVNDYEITGLGTYYIRHMGAGLDSDICWTIASSGLTVSTMNYSPPAPVVTLNQRRGNTEIVFSNGNASYNTHVFNYADYYWVSSPTSTTILSEYCINGKLKEWRKYLEGTYYLRGRDRGTNTWGEGVPIVVTIQNDNGLNWTRTKTFDGSSTPVVIAESKSYFDNSGKPLQSQIRNLEKEYVFATENLRDKSDRVVGSTLPTPVQSEEFLYNDRLFLNENEEDYSVEDFDELNTRYSPKKAGNYHVGTTGWYYSSNNTWEPNIGKTEYPYSRIEFYEDGTGEIKRSATAGNQHHLGSGHEVLTGTFPIVNELDDYYNRRSEQIQFMNTSFIRGTKNPWENFNPFGGNRLNFEWAYEGVLNTVAPPAAGWSGTSLIGQKRVNNVKWPVGSYVIRLHVSNQSTGGVAPLTSGLSVYASDTPSSSAATIAYTGDGSVDVGITNKEITISFNVSQAYDYLLFAFNKSGSSSGYTANIAVSDIEIVSYNGKPQGILETYSKGFQTVSRDENGKYAISITDEEGKTVMVARKGSSGTGEHMLEINNVFTGYATTDGSSERQSLLYFYILDDQAVTIQEPQYGLSTTQYGNNIEEDTYNTAKPVYRSSNQLRLLPGFSVTGGQTFQGQVTAEGRGWSVENIITGEILPEYETFANASGIWPAGFYRIVVRSGEATVSYKNYFQDVSYQFYDDAGRLKTSVSPNGFKKWIEQPNPATNFSIIDKTTYTYNFKGWLTSMTEPDAGTTTYKYRKDGKIRFSQNAQQGADQKFSYTQYDQLGRPKESGEYKGTTYTYAALSSQLEYASQVIFTSADTKDWIRTYYDFPDANLFSQTDLPSSDPVYKQDFVRGAVSYTENENIKTWYSYDELGRVTWMAQKPKTLNRTFVSTYQYDFLGNVLRTGSLSYEDEVVKESFYHHYAYDKDKRLKQAFTSTDGTHKTLRATYDYYLHGPLKRVELGNGVQGIDFIYNVQGWLTQINHPSLETSNDPGEDGTNGVRKDVFGMSLDYYESEMDDLFPTTALNLNPVSPQQFHKLPEDVSEQNMQLAQVKVQPVMQSSQQQWMGQVKQIKDYFISQKNGKVKTELKHQDLFRDNQSLPDQPVPQEEYAIDEIIKPDFKADETTLVASTNKNTVVLPMPAGLVDDALEFAALKALYDSLGGSSWTTKTNWPAAGSWPASATPTQMDAWYGITVTNGDITNVTLYSNNLTGKIPSAIANLTALKELSLRSNNLTGKIPSAISSLSALERLELYTNQLTGGIPSSLSNLTNLKVLRLYGNALGGSIPASLGSLTNLEQLQLRTCQLTGTVPASLKNLSHLLVLDFSSNAITGNLPPLGKLANLQTLSFSGCNNLSPAAIPAWIDSLRNLITLNLESTQRTGTIPSFIGNLEDLESLILRVNQLTGSLPAQLGNLSQLTYFAVNNNQLTGSIPAEIGNLANLTTLLLFTNQLTGSIPASLYSLTKLELLQLNGNQLSGNLSPEIRNLSKLITLDLRTNALSGEIPAEIGNLTLLVNLYLHFNQFSGDLPQSVRLLTKLKQLYVNDNLLTGTVPNLGTLTDMEFLQLQNNQFTGAIGSWIGSLKKLKTFRLDNNKITSVDAILLSAPLLTNVYLSGNELTAIPNFYTYSNKTNLNLYAANNYLDFSDLEPLFGTGTHGIKIFSYLPQKKFTALPKVHVPAGQIFEKQAQPKGTYSTVTWEKQNGASWTNINSSNENTTQQSYKVSNATSTLNGTYRWRMTNTRVTGLTLECDPVEVTVVDALAVQASGPALYNGIIASARWQTEAPATESRDPLKGMYLYKYDDKYQVTEANWAEPNYLINTFALANNTYRVTNLAYDPNGNIKSLTRYDKDAIRTNNFTYTYEANKNKLTSVSGHVNAYTYNAIGQMTGEDKVTGDDQYVMYDVSGKVRKVFSDAAKTQLKVEYLYDDRGFRMAKVNRVTDRTTWYIRDASGNILSMYEQEGTPATTNTHPITQTEVPVYGAGKLGMYYPAQDGSVNYELTDHLGNVRALVRDNVNIYTATMEDDGTTDLTNPRVEEMQYFQNLFETEIEDFRFNHTSNGEYSAYLYWIGGSGNQHKAVGPAITLKVSAGDTVKAETWVRFENKLSYSRNVNIATIAGLLSGNFSFTSGFENFTMPQTTTAFSNALTSAGFMGDGVENERPFAYLNYILFDESMVMVDAGWKRVDENAGFDPGEEGLANQHLKISLEGIQVPEDGYIYVWVSNEGEGTKVWFDDVKVTHSQVMVTQATDYDVWGDVLREQKTDETTYRHGYQSAYSEKDQETGWNAFELRQYDPIIGRWSTKDPYGQYYSPYVGMGNNPLTRTDPDGGLDEYDVLPDGTQVWRSNKGGSDIDYFNYYAIDAVSGGLYYTSTTAESKSFMGWLELGLSTSKDMYLGLTIEVDRFLFTDESTISQFTLNGDTRYFLEPVWDPDRAQTRGSDRAISPGTYNLVSHVSCKYEYGKAIRLIDVPGRQSILIHSGRKPDDTLGCLLPGCGIGLDELQRGTTRQTFQEIWNAFDSNRYGARIIIGN